MTETDWFPCTEKPVRDGVYKTRHYRNEKWYEGYSYWHVDRWGVMDTTPKKAAWWFSKNPSMRILAGVQSKEWKGLLKEESNECKTDAN